MHIDITGSALDDPDDAATDLMEKLGDTAADFVFLCFTSGTSPLALARLVLGLRTNAVHGASACLGPVSPAETGAPVRLAAFVVRDPDGDYGTARADFDGNPRPAAAKAVRAALAQAGRAGEVPDAVWLTATPGSEEAVIAGIQDVVGDRVPVIGGTAADDDRSGRWYVLGSDGISRAGMAVSVLFPSTRIGFACRSACAATDLSGIATKVDGRHLIEIDGTPAGQVYAGWTGAAAQFSDDDPGGVPCAPALPPLGRRIDAAWGATTYLPAYPVDVAKDKGLTLGCEVVAGETVTLMHAEPGELAARARGVATQALPRDIPPDRVAGALTVFCGSHVRAMPDGRDAVVRHMADALGQAPFLGFCGFGQQGPVPDAGNRHGNVMISCLVFTRDG